MVAALYFHICGRCLIFAVKKKTMATLIQQPQQLCFSSSLADIVFGTNAGSGRLVMTLTHNGSSMNILDETYYADSDGTVTLYDLSSLLEPYARQYLEVVVNCSFTDSAGTASVTPVTVLFSMADVDMPAETFVNTHFLSILNGEKMTAMGREERLYMYGTGTVTVSAYIQMASGEFVTSADELSPIQTTGNIRQYDVSPSEVESVLGLVGGKILSYDVECGMRSQRFVMTEDSVPPAPSLLFTNSFGCQEFIHCVGTHKKDSKYDRQSTRIHGKLRNYRITENRQFVANTGWLNEAMADWADELFRSEEVYLWVDDTVGRQVVISESKSEITNDDDNMPAFEFTYGYAQRIHNVLQPSHAGRIFDNTFDATFN